MFVAQIACGGGQGGVEVVQLAHVHGRKGDADVAVAVGDHAHAVLFQQVLAVVLGVDPFELQAHEVAGVEGVRLPEFGILGRCEDRPDVLGPACEDLLLLLPLGQQRVGAQRLGQHRLG